MADRSKGSSSKPITNSLLFTAGGGLPFEGFGSNALLMPVAPPESETSILTEELGEVDTFVGQSPESSAAPVEETFPKPFTLFRDRPTSTSDPFSFLSKPPTVQQTVTAPTGQQVIHTPTAQLITASPTVQQAFPAPITQIPFAIQTTQQSFTTSAGAQRPFPATINQQTFPVPTIRQTFAVPTTQQTFPVPTIRQTFADPTTQQTFAVPTIRQTFAVPTTQQPFAVPSTQQNFAGPTTQQTFAVPTTQQNFAVPIIQQTFPIPTTPQTYPPSITAAAGSNISSSIFDDPASFFDNPIINNSRHPLFPIPSSVSPLSQSKRSTPSFFIPSNSTSPVSYNPSPSATPPLSNPLVSSNPTPPPLKPLFTVPPPLAVSSPPAVLPSMTFYGTPLTPNQAQHQAQSSLIGPPPTAIVNPLGNTSGNSYRLMNKQRPVYAASTPLFSTASTQIPLIESTKVYYPPPPMASSNTNTVTAGSYTGGQAYPQEVSNIPPSFAQLTGNEITPGIVYEPITPHWFYRQIVEKKCIWRPFSRIDSQALEEAYVASITTGETIVATDGDRFDVHVVSRKRYAVYWDEEEPSEVRRCTWFLRGPADAKFVPYEEEFSMQLESQYCEAATTNIWHIRRELGNGEAIVMHSPTTMVHFQPTTAPVDGWGNVDPQVKPHVIRRGIEEEMIEDGESKQTDHLVFLVHGIGAVCDFKFRSICEAVDEFRSLVQQLMKSHFSSAVTSGLAGRVEFLPVSWHLTLHGDNTGIDRKLQPITLRSIPKLRHFTNDTLLDILFYTSPMYCQTIVDKVGGEINRMHTLFCQRNPSFNGGVSLVGHSLGCLILFDILLHQNTPSKFEPPDPPNCSRESTPAHSLQAQKSMESSDPETLEDLLTSLQLDSDTLDVLRNEKLDLATLLECSDDDLKQLGLPMGPRKKLNTEIKIINDRQKRKKEQVRLSEAGSHESMISMSKIVNYAVGMAGTGQPFISYPQFSFTPTAFFALGSPIAMFVTVRGLDTLGDSFCLPTCPSFFNVFHPFDPVAYRMETLIDPSLVNTRPLLIPHHKGRKRMHLELKETMARMGTDLKQKLIDSVWSTWNTVYQFARFHKDDPQTLRQEVDKAFEEQIAHQAETESMASASEDQDIMIGQLNGGRRIDYVLQEAPLESFNEYLFALTSHLCYWESEDTMLLILKEIYGSMGINQDIVRSSSLASQFLSHVPPYQQPIPNAPILYNPPPTVPYNQSSTPPISYNKLPQQMAYNPPTPAMYGDAMPICPPTTPIQSSAFPYVISGRPLANPVAGVGMDPTAPLQINLHIPPPPKMGFLAKK